MNRKSSFSHPQPPAGVAEFESPRPLPSALSDCPTIQAVYGLTILANTGLPYTAILTHHSSQYWLTIHGENCLTIHARELTHHTRP